MKPKLEVQRVSYSYHAMEGETPALSDISFTADVGEFIAIVGPSGCGKSTLLSLLSGLAEPESGSILIDGRPVSQAKDTIGYMLQKDHLFEWRSILSNVSLGLEIQKRLNPDSRSHLKEMLRTYGLEQFQDKRPSQLSGGMRQRAALIRTLAMEPDLLLLDEPFSALDYQTRLSVCDDISSIIRETRKTAVLVTHDLSEAISVADRIVILSARPATVKRILTLSFTQPPAGSADADTTLISKEIPASVPGGDSGVISIPDGESGIVSIPDGESSIVSIPDGESSIISIPDRESSIVSIPDRENSIVSIPGRDSRILSPMERRNAPEFSYYFNLIWKELKRDDIYEPQNL